MALADSTVNFKIRNLKARIQNPVADRYALPLLVVTTVLSVAIYAWALTKPVNLIEYGARPLFDLYRYAKIDPFVLLKLVIAFIALGGLYWLAGRLVRERSSCVVDRDRRRVGVWHDAVAHVSV